MGKGDKKTKRGKIIIGSAGVRRTRKKKKHLAPASAKAEPKPKTEVVEQETPPVQTAPKKTAKKADEHPVGAEEKPKTTKTKKKAAESKTEAADQEPKQE